LAKLHSENEGKSMDRFRIYYYVLSFVSLVVAVWIGFFLDIKIETQYIPTLVNGITSSLSVIVGFTGATIGIMLREIEKHDKKAKEFYFRTLALLMLPLTLLWTTYTFLTVDMPQLSVNAALSGLISALYVFIMVIVFTVKNMTADLEKKDTQEASSPNEDKKDISKEKTVKVKIEDKTEKESNRDIDLVKIQIHADRCHAVLTSALSFIFVFFSLVVIFYGVLYQNVNFTSVTAFLTAFNIWYVGTFTIIGVTLIFLFVVRKNYLKNIRAISDMMEAVKEGKDLPPLDELGEWKKQGKKNGT
jgi:hypothetical protein